MFKRKKDFKRSYSQSGEDMIIDILFKYFKIRKPSYLDIGAHDPTKFNNTYYFYKKGCTGVNIEPDPVLFEKFPARRRRDINLNVGVAAKQGSMDFYVFPGGTLSTCCKETAKRYADHVGQAEKTLKIDVVNVNDVIKENFKTKPNFVSLDVEGLEMEILKSFDFQNCRPEAFCIETVTYGECVKTTDAIEYMESVGYMVYADTFINTIFTEKNLWENSEYVRGIRK